MRIRRSKAEVPGLNTTSTADISFMLLVFFLVTTSMYVDKAFTRRLPAKENDKKEKKEIAVDKENMLNIRLLADGNTMLNDSVVRRDDMKQLFVDFILTRGKEHVMVINMEKTTNYDHYYATQNTLSRAYDEAREKLAMQKHHLHFDALTTADKEKILSECPQRIAEDYLDTEKEEGEGNARKETTA